MFLHVGKLVVTKGPFEDFLNRRRFPLPKDAHPENPGSNMDHEQSANDHQDQAYNGLPKWHSLPGCHTQHQGRWSRGRKQGHARRDRPVRITQDDKPDHHGRHHQHPDG